MGKVGPTCPVRLCRDLKISAGVQGVHSCVMIKLKLRESKSVAQGHTAN